mmetsp:Transcript_18248/g.59250  ORF Transcript_18248/g.59250 Transcript_18248/m.59250 type:complete len:323 (+) Transcript_18248:110-1078(+)
MPSTKTVCSPTTSLATAATSLGGHGHPCCRRARQCICSCFSSRAAFWCMSSLDGLLADYLTRHRRHIAGRSWAPLLPEGAAVHLQLLLQPGGLLVHVQVPLQEALHVQRAHARGAEPAGTVRGLEEQALAQLRAPREECPELGGEVHEPRVAAAQQLLALLAQADGECAGVLLPFQCQRHLAPSATVRRSVRPPDVPQPISGLLEDLEDVPLPRHRGLRGGQLLEPPQKLAAAGGRVASIEGLHARRGRGACQLRSAGVPLGHILALVARSPTSASARRCHRLGRRRWYRSALRRHRRGSSAPGAAGIRARRGPRVAGTPHA